MGAASLKANLLQELTAIREEVLYEFFRDLRKSYDVLNWEICMENIVGYGFIPRMKRILRYYWYNFSMMDRVGCCYGNPFKGHQSVTMGVPLSPTIFNMLVDVVIFH